MYGTYGASSGTGVNLKHYLTQLSYSYIQKTVDDCNKLMTNIKTITPMITDYQHDNLQTEKLVVLSGTIPMYYRAKRYNIPVKIYLTKAHPVQSPIAYVCPTAGMMVKPNHRNVNQSNGRVYIPYLSSWNYQSSSLYDLVNTMSMIFGQDPPVYKKPAKAAVPKTTSVQPSYTGSYYGQNTGSGSGSMYMTNTNYQQPQANVYNQKSSYRKEPTPQEKLAAKKAELTSRVIKVLTERKGKLGNSLQTESTDCTALTQKKNEQDNMLRVLNQSIEQITLQTSQLEDLKKKAEEYISKNQGSVDVDNIIKIQDPVQKQNMEAKAKSEVYNDIMYTMDRAAGNKKISMEDWSKFTNKYARKQFMKKALSKKIDARKKF